MNRVWLSSLLCGVCLCVGLGASKPAHAQFAVIDVNAAVQWVQQLASWYEQLNRMRMQYEELQQTRKALKDPRQFVANLANSYFERDYIRRYIPADFELAMNLRYGTSSGSAGNALYVHYLRQLAEEAGIPEVDDLKNIFANMSESTQFAYDQRLRSSQSIMAGSRTMQQNLESRLHSLEGLIDDAASSDDLQTSATINSRMTAEVGLLTAESLRLQGQMSYLQSASAQDQLNSQARAISLARWEHRGW
jgi:hypothetical protein